MKDGKQQRVSILGGGWLGKPMAKTLEEKGYAINLSTASDENYKRLKEEGWNAFQIQVYAEAIKGEIQRFLEADILIVNITPSRAEREKEQFASLMPYLEQSSVQKVLFISSTSVYPFLNRMVTEDEGVELLDHPLYKSEQLFFQNPAFQTTIVRMAGLIGGRRHPGRFFAKRLDANNQPKGGLIKNSTAFVNLIHLDDCLQVIEQILEQNAWQEVFNACADAHPSKGEFYTQATASLGLELPVCAEQGEPYFKIIDNSKVKAHLGISWIHANLMDLLEPESWK